MGYVDYSYYTDTYKGSAIPETAFGNLILKAEGLVNTYTFNRISEIMPYMDKVKMCCCELAELISSHETELGKGSITSEKVGGYSVTYADTEKIKAAFNTDTKSIMFKWLAMTDLLYRGCY